MKMIMHMDESIIDAKEFIDCFNRGSELKLTYVICDYFGIMRRVSFQCAFMS